MAEYLAVQDWALTPPTITNGVYAKFENNMTDEAGRQTMTPSGGAYAADWAVGGYSRKGGSLNFSGNTDDFVFDGDFCLAFVAKGGESQTVSIDFIDEYWTAPWSFYLYWEDSGFPSPAYIMWGPGGFYYVELADLGADPARIEVSRSGSTIKLWVNGVLAATETDGATWGAGGGVDTFDIYLSSGAYLDEFVVNKGTAWHTTAYAPYALAQSVVIGETKLNDAGTGANDLWSAEQIASELAVLDAAKFDVADVATDLDYYEAGQVLEATLAVDRSLGFAVSGLVEDDDDGKIVVSKAKYGPGMSVGVDFVNEWSSLYRGDGRLQMTYEPRGGTPVYDETFEGWKVAETAGSGHIRGAVWYCGRIGEVAPRSAAFAGDAYGDDFVISYQAHRNATGVPASLQYVQDGTQVWKLYWFSDTTVRLDFLGANYDWTGLTVAADAWQWLLVERHEGVLYLAVDGTRHATTHAETGGVANYPVYTRPGGKQLAHRHGRGHRDRAERRQQHRDHLLQGCLRHCGRVAPLSPPQCDGAGRRGGTDGQSCPPVATARCRSTPRIPAPPTPTPAPPPPRNTTPGSRSCCWSATPTPEPPRWTWTGWEPRTSRPARALP